MLLGWEQNIDLPLSADAQPPQIRHTPPAALIHRELSRAGVLGIRLIGPPGSGKTTLIEATLERIDNPQRVAVIVVHPISQSHKRCFEKYGATVIQIDSDIPRPAAVWRAIAQLKLTNFDVIFMEGYASRAPILQDLGQDVTVTVMSILDGDDKALFYRPLIDAASLVLLSKCDLHPFVVFDREAFADDVKTVKHETALFEVSAADGIGMPQWLQWLSTMQAEKRWPGAMLRPDSFDGIAEFQQTSGEMFLG